MAFPYHPPTAPPTAGYGAPRSYGFTWTIRLRYTTAVTTFTTATTTLTLVAVTLQPSPALNYSTPTIGTPNTNYTAFYLIIIIIVFPTLGVFILFLHYRNMARPQRKIKPTLKAQPDHYESDSDDDNDFPDDNQSQLKKASQPEITKAAATLPDPADPTETGLPTNGDHDQSTNNDSGAVGKPKRNRKSTAKAKALSSEGNHDGLDSRSKINEKKTPKGKRNTKRTPKTKAAKDDDSEDELAASGDDKSEREKDAEFLTTDPKSPFVHMDLIAEFLKPDFRTLITEEDKKEIADLLPDHISLTADGQLPEDFIRYNTDFRSAMRQYQVDLGEGRLDPSWLAEAAAAMEERARGDFDRFKEEQFEEFWGQKQKVDSKALAGQSSTVKLHRLIEAGLCKEGDLWSYSRVFGQGKAKVHIEKEFKLTDIEGGTLTFAVPPGTAKYARRLKVDSDTIEKPVADTPASPGSDSAISSIPSDVEDYIPITITSLTALEEKIVALDGKFSGKVNGNAWKSIRVKRKEQDLGSLFDIRENFFVYGKAK